MNGKPERVFVAVDVMNIWYSARNEFGDGARLNYSKLIEFINKKPFIGANRSLNLVAYTITSLSKQMDDGSVRHVGPRNKKFVNLLKGLGYAVRNRDMLTLKGFNKPFATDWDMGIAIDAKNKIDTYDTFCLVSGDGDYLLLLEDLKKNGKKVEVITVKSNASRYLHVAAHMIYYLTEKEIVFTEYQHGEDTSKA